VLECESQVAVGCADVGDRKASGELREVTVGLRQESVEVGDVARDVIQVPVDWFGSLQPGRCHALDVRVGLRRAFRSASVDNRSPSMSKTRWAAKREI